MVTKARGVTTAALLLALVAAPVDGAPGQRARSGRGTRAAVAPRPSAPVPRGPAVDVNGLLTFAETPAPFARGEYDGPQPSEPQVQALLAANCPAQLITQQYSNREDRAWLVDFDQAFAPSVRAADPGLRQSGEEAYRRCLDRAIQAVQTSRSYVVRNPDDKDCIDCTVKFSDLALQVPRLRILKGLTYLAPGRMADQDPARALAAMREGVAAFAKVQSDFQFEAEMAFDAKRRAVRQEQRAAEERAMAQTKGAAIGSLLGAGLGMAMGLGAQQSFQMADTSMRQRFGEINSELAVREQAVSAKQQVVNANREGMFAAPAYGKWSDDGIRVTLPIVKAGVGSNGKAVWGELLGAMTGAFHTDNIMHLSAQENSRQGWGCTGAAVGPRLVLTNRHCAVTNDGNGVVLPPGNITLAWKTVVAGAAGMRTANDVVHVTAIYTSDLAQPLTLASQNDWALLVTRENVGGSHWLELADPARVARAGEMRVAVAGYSGDLNGGSEITMDWGCRARWHNGSLFHLCHMWHGASGSPIVAVDGAFDRQTIVGVNSAYYGEMKSGSDPGLRVGAASDALYRTYIELREQQRGEERQ